ncbi:Small, acid-soluble spore protein, alpha/beta type [Sulfobacillus thermosulfidooxidans DSM 9293]|uniref:Small, acid-soluble spore protein, alpha/beta type n=2 Tax=Sulfobacillus thermosulfidooxidans TaxID=28034 RepID=A0A1W1WI59_SULTA|nr:small, acid-soluble spore protein, alpha/beta type [Sulfobacillus thermosulfidooxidans]PSR24429.1 MAG: small, acid-soluble spore protein, alpha/beta type [Sulfobacillus thermosulfidooxidans]SMC06001.1 Small, acid-soluble spore protein, alpha/beta type [Sulfobacillus thermosulfidooxidans DSM 9293]
MSPRKKLLVPEASQALDKLREEILKELRINRQPMREQFRDTARRIAEQADKTNRDP